jgi:sulfur carrier protein
MVKINGEDCNADNLLLMDFLLREGYSPQKIAVEINGDIVPKSQYATKKLLPDDAVEIVKFVGGG